MTDKPITSNVTWRPIKTRCDSRPDAEAEVLIYDGYIDSTVIGFTEDNDDGSVSWIDVQTQLPLRDPQWWTEIPFPCETVQPS